MRKIIHANRSSIHIPIGELMIIKDVRKNNLAICVYDIKGLDGVNTKNDKQHF